MKNDFSQKMFSLPNLPFEKDAMPDFCSAKTFDFHHGAHHKTYVEKLNAAIAGTDFEKMDETHFDEIIRASHAAKNLAIFNNAAQHFNHSFFWKCLSPAAGGDPTGKIAEKMAENFETFENFKKEFENAAATLFGSGWVFLAQNADGALEIEKYPNADTPIIRGKTPILALDVWEHAYYLDFQNRRPAFASAFWGVVNWDFANKNLQK